MKIKRFSSVTVLVVLLIVVLMGVFSGPDAAGAVDAFTGPGLYDAILYTGQGLTDPAGTVNVWNSRQGLHIRTETNGDWDIAAVDIYVGVQPAPTKVNGVPIVGQFPYREKLAQPASKHTLHLSLNEDLNFFWGESWDAQRFQTVAVHVELVAAVDNGSSGTQRIVMADAWAEGDYDFKSRRDGMWFYYQMAHPGRAHFNSGAPVEGLTFLTPTHEGWTDASGSFDYFPGEEVELAVGPVVLGAALVDHRFSPLDLFEEADSTDPRVVNMTRFLQSLDVNGDLSKGISITDDVVACLDQACANPDLVEVDLANIDFSKDDLINALIDGTIAACESVEEVTLVKVLAEDAQASLEKALDSTMFRKNISRSPQLASSKSKLNIMGVWFPAMRANGDPAEIGYYDDTGALIRTATEAKPVVVVYTDGVEETGAEDIFAAISRDDGHTFKRTNLSRAADRSSFTLADGTEYYGEAKKPVFQVKGNNILVAWTSKFCSGGSPAYAIDPEDDYPYDDPYYQQDIWGVGGPQRSVDYTEQDFPEVGEVPYSCVWVARGTIVTQGMITSGGFWADKAVGDIVWFKPERLTSGRRDANQVFMGASDGAGFAIAWQEDPQGLRPGAAAGPGPGWGGATTSHKTDIWYSYITMADFRKIDADFVAGDPKQSGGNGTGVPDPNPTNISHDVGDDGRPKALVPMSLPVRVSDNDVVNTDNLMVELDGSGYPVVGGEGNWVPIINEDTQGDGTGTHAYGYEIEGLCEGFYEFTNHQDALKKVCITSDNRLLDGDTGASRPNLFMQTYTKPDGTKSAWVIMAYEETKGAGDGPPDWEPDSGPHGGEYVAEVGKNAIYHSFDFQNPDLVSAGNIINLPERDAEGNLVYLREEGVVDADGNVTQGDRILDWQGLPILAYENARRPRFIIQGKSAAGASGTVMLVLYKEGQEGMGRPSDIMLRRVVSTTPGNPYAFTNYVCDGWETTDNGQIVCVAGAQNMSSVTPTVTAEAMGDPISEDPYGAVKVVEWVQTVDNLADLSSTNPYDDARAHRGAIRGDFVVMGFSYTPNWAAARNGNDKYDFYVRRSFDGGQTWTTDPYPMDPEAVYETCNTWTYPSGTGLPGTKVEVCTTYGPGEFEQMRNLSQLPNNKESVIEPRIVACPGTIKVDGVWTGIAEDKQSPNVFYVSYGTSTNPKKDPETGEQEAPYPLDLYYSFSQDRGESFVEVEWVVNPDSAGNNAGETVTGWDRLAKGDPEQGEAQLRMTPDGSRFYATWLQEGEEGSDIWFRRIMSPAFPANVAATP